MKTRVLIAEDHAFVREGTRRILEEQADCEVVAEAADGESAVELARRMRPDVALVDIRLPRLNGVEVTRRLRSTSPGTRVLILSAYDDDDYVFALMEAGAAGYLLKTAPAREVVEAVRSVAKGETVLHPAITQKIARLWSEGGSRPAPSPPRDEHPLTPREMEVLRLVAKGLRNMQIAEALHVSVRTVEGHLSSIFGKLGVTSRTGAVIYGAQHHWFTVSEEGDPRP
ncbi:LuxR family transcriptional regulator [Limnochorda pilosa]|uniref:LuxR family transcriptional regulator n=1 Tax=Limnochorda pilosa TaxID=1555112 RepID=A0A0K2SQA0_LIMPI|nr:LuxR family transcriptional regulator [Limnochorda pilosa]